MTGRAAAGSFRLAQLSDCHLSADPATAYRGVCADEGLRAIVARTMAWKPDAVLLSGDVSEDASPASYARAAALLASLRRPVLALPGNHDLPAEMQTRFVVGPWNGPRVVALGAWRVVLLDSTVSGRVDGRIAESDLHWLSAWLGDRSGGAGGAPVLIALHHQPVPVGSSWIDRYMLEAPESLLRLIAAQPAVRCVTWGHVHQHLATRCGRARLYACPSTAANSLPHTESFTMDPAGPAGRWFELFADGRMRTGLLRPP